MGRFRELYRPRIVGGISGDAAYTVEGVHPFREVMIVLSIPIPFQSFVQGIGRPPFVHLFPDPQAPLRGVHCALLLIQAADPAGSGVVFTVPAEYGMNLIDEVHCEMRIFLLACVTRKSQEVAHGKRVSP